MDFGFDINLDEEAWARVGSYPHAGAAHEHALVVLAMGLPCTIEVEPGSAIHHLLVPIEQTERANSELRAYAEDLEQAKTIKKVDPGNFSHSPGWFAYLLWAAILITVHQLKLNHPEIGDVGASSSIGLYAQGEWWRPFTALFLHADAEHLLGNLLSGLFFSILVASSIGAWRGWLLILACGTLANIATSGLKWPDYYTAIGASTAVFAALGILSGLGLAWMFRFRKQVPWLRVIAPVIGGVVILGMTGSASPESNTDVLSHILGFLTGMIAGAIWGSLTSYTASSGTSMAESDART